MTQDMRFSSNSNFQLGVPGTTNLKLIYLSFSKLTDKLARDWYIDYSVSRGAIVEYWDIVSLVREEHDDEGLLDVNYVRHIKTYCELKKMVCQPGNNNAIYVMLLAYSGRFSEPYRLLSRYGCKMVFLNWGAMPVTYSAPRLKRIITNFCAQPIDFFLSAISVILGIFYRKLNIVKRYDLVLVAGHALTLTDQYAKKVVPFNLCDFDCYSIAKLDNAKIIQGRYAVFLDINLPYQSDLAICGLPEVTAADYFKSLNRFFDILERIHGLKVVIARHPTATYPKNKFEQRENHRMLTAELVKNAEYVITHTSTALSYAVLNLKPVLFIYTDEMAKIYRDTVIRQITSLAAYLDANVYAIDRVANDDFIEIRQPNIDRYDIYKYAYLTSRESENSASNEIFWREINAI